jgi:hypothetical protein
LFCIIAPSRESSGILNETDDTEVRARKYGEAVVSTLSTVASVLEYPRGNHYYVFFFFFYMMIEPHC